MVVLYAGGKRLGTWAESERLIADAVKAGPVELRDETGRVFAVTEPLADEPIRLFGPSPPRR